MIVSWVPIQAKDLRLDRGIFDQQSRVPTCSTEVVHEDAPGPCRIGAAFPNSRLSSDPDIPLLKIGGKLVVDLGFDTTVRNNGILLHHEHDLDEA